MFSRNRLPIWQELSELQLTMSTNEQFLKKEKKPMTRKFMAATFLFVMTAAIALNGMFKSETAVVEANTAATAASPAFGICDSPFVKNVRVKSLGRSDFEVTWEYAPPDPCLLPKEFRVTVEARRKVGGNLLATDRRTVNGTDRRFVGTFRSIAGIDRVDARVETTITEIRPPSATGSFLQQ
jgi:hypothetical protein